MVTEIMTILTTTTMTTKSCESAAGDFRRFLSLAWVAVVVVMAALQWLGLGLGYLG